jgi:DNA-binding MarR family transcriptional regulator
MEAIDMAADEVGDDGLDDDDLDEELSPGPIPALEVSIIRSIHGAYHALNQRLTSASRTEGLGAAEAIVLAELRRNPGCTSLEARRELGFHRSTFSSVLDRLERAGMIERARNGYDGRRYEIHLTTSGQVRADGAREALGQVEQELRGYTTWTDRRGARAVFEACGAVAVGDPDDFFD